MICDPLHIIPVIYSLLSISICSKKYSYMAFTNCNELLFSAFNYLYSMNFYEKSLAYYHFRLYGKKYSKCLVTKFQVFTMWSSEQCFFDNPKTCWPKYIDVNLLSIHTIEVNISVDFVCITLI